MSTTQEGRGRIFRQLNIMLIQNNQTWIRNTMYTTSPKPPCSWLMTIVTCCLFDFTCFRWVANTCYVRKANMCKHLRAMKLFLVWHHEPKNLTHTNTPVKQNTPVSWLPNSHFMNQNHTHRLLKLNYAIQLFHQINAFTLTYMHILWKTNMHIIMHDKYGMTSIKLKIHSFWIMMYYYCIYDLVLQHAVSWNITLHRIQLQTISH